jgi:SNF2 family DNA or RNA helicase
MASIMDRDPWAWNASDVKDFFMSRHAEQATAEMPGANLPPPASLTEHLVNEGITGAILLSEVDHDFLRNRCKIAMLAQRAAVMHCIKKLRAISPGCKSQDQLTIWPTPAELQPPIQLTEEQLERLFVEKLVPGGRLAQFVASHLALVPAVAQVQAGGQPMQLDEVQPTAPGFPTPVTSDQMRPNESIVETKDGKKKRRLDLSATIQQAPKASQDFGSGDAELTLPGRNLPIDEIFFDGTATGNECGAMKIDHPLYIHEGSDIPEYDPKNFQYVNPDLHLGVSQYVSSKLQRSMFTQEETTLSRHGRYAVAMYPYATGLKLDRTQQTIQYGRRGRIMFGGTRSAMLVKFRAAAGPEGGSDDDSEASCIATRESEIVLATGADEYDAGEGLSGEHEHLLLKYREDENDLMSESDEQGSQEGSDSRDDNASSEFGDDLAEEIEEEGTVGQTDVKDIIDRVFEEYIAKWRETVLPQLEAKKAWTVWKQMKRSKTIRDQLIEGARTTIGHLQFRLSKARKEFEDQIWEDKASLERVCRNFEATVEDIQHQRWKIEVWGRTQEPAHTTARRTSNKRTISAPTHAQHHNTLPILGSQDRLSVSPRPASPMPQPADMNDRNSDMEREQFHTLQGSPVLHQEDSPFVVPDDDMMQVDDPDQATAGASKDEDMTEPTSELQPHDDHPESDHAKTPSKLNRESKTVILKTPTAAARVHDPISADMPSPSVLARRKSVKSSPAASVIDITGTRSSSIEPITPAQAKAQIKKVEKSRKRGRPSTNGVAHDEVPSTSEADRWSYSELVEGDDRNKLLQKLLRDIGQKKREAIWNLYQKLGLPRFLNQTMAAMDTIGSREESHSADDANETPKKSITPDRETPKLGARLILAHYFMRPEIPLEAGPLPADLDLDSLPSRQDVTQIIRILVRFLMERGKPMYASPLPDITSRDFSSYDDPIEILDTDDEMNPPGGLGKHFLKDSTPRSTRKRQKTKADFEAENKRKAARDRLVESQHQQSSDALMLQNMILDSSSPGDKIINYLRKPDQEPIFIEAKIAKKMKPYQLEGVQFLWRELTSDPDEAQGCLLAHTMGLGKTMQSIALLRCVDTASQASSENITSQLPRDLQLGAERNKRSLRFLIICPSSLLPNWLRELHDWTHESAFGGRRFFSIESTTANAGFMGKLKDWAKYGGVLLVGYPIFQRIVNRQAKEVAEEEQSDARKVAEVQMSNENMELARRIITEDAELIVADEAHHLKNPQTSTAKAAIEIRSNARIALTGTPMSNDVDEIYALISWVSPGYLGDKAHFSDYFGVPIKNGLYVDSTTYEKRRSTIKLKSLHHEIEPKVHRAGISVLKGELKQKVEFVITVELTEQQSEAYAATVAALLGATKDLHLTSLTNIFAWLGVLGLLTAHPRCFRQKLLTAKPPPKEGTKAAAKAAASRKPTSTATVQDSGARTSGGEPDAAKSNEGSPEVPGDENVYALGFTEAIVNELVEGLTEDIDPALSAKTQLTQKILRLSKKCGDKVLIFSASIPSLDYLSHLLHKERINFGRIDGSMKMSERTKLLDRFKNDRENLDVLLISTRAGGQGLNIQSANRVIIFDFGFNPAWEEQAIGRAYRFGQTKPVFVYRFVAGGTFESNIYNTQMFKTSLASRVVDKKNPQRNAIRNTREYLYPPKAVKHEDLTNELEVNLDPHVLSKIMEAQIARGDARDPSLDICTVRTMEVLQAEDQEAPLDSEELKQVEEMRATWKAERSSGSRPTATDAAMAARLMAAPSSTAPVIAGASGIRTASMPSSTQGPAQSAATVPRTLTQVPNTTTSFPARDIRNGNGMGPPGTSMNMGGLPYSGPN